MSNLIQEFAEKGISLFLEGEKLRYRAPTGAITPEVLAVIKENKTAIIAELSSPAVTEAGADVLSDDVTDKTTVCSDNLNATLSDNSNDHHGLDWWISQLKLCNNRQDVFSLLAKFRPLSWSDYERSQMSHGYIGRLNQIGEQAVLDRERQVSVRSYPWWARRCQYGFLKKSSS